MTIHTGKNLASPCVQVVCVNHNKAEPDKAAKADQEDPGDSLPLPSSQQTQHSREETGEA